MRSKENSNTSPWLLDEETNTAIRALESDDRQLFRRIFQSGCIDNNLEMKLYKLPTDEYTNSKFYTFHYQKHFQKVSNLRGTLAKVQTAEKRTIPLGFFMDLCLPHDRAEETRVGLQDVYEKRWLKRYTSPVARSLCCVHVISMVLAYHGSKISKFIAIILGFLGFKKLTGWFSGT